MKAIIYTFLFDIANIERITIKEMFIKRI